MAALIPEVVGHDRVIANWLKAQKNLRLAGVYLLAGPSGIGKQTTAWALAQAYLCEVSSTGCGTCPSCLKVAKKQSENIHFVQPAGQQIKTEQAQEVLRFLSLKSWGGKRVVIIDQVQALNPSAANSLLKTLEDPPADTQFFLIAPSSSAVLPTLRSRCQVFTFYPVTLENMKKKSQAPDWMLRASRGSFEKLSQLQEETSAQVRKTAAQMLESCVLRNDFLTTDAWREPLKEKGMWSQYLIHWSYLLRDAMYTQLKKKDQILNTDLAPFLDLLAARSMEQLLSWQEAIFQWQNELLINRDPQLQMETLSIRTQRRPL